MYVGRFTVAPWPCTIYSSNNCQSFVSLVIRCYVDIRCADGWHVACWTCSCFILCRLYQVTIVVPIIKVLVHNDLSVFRFFTLIKCCKILFLFFEQIARKQSKRSSKTRRRTCCLHQHRINTAHLRHRCHQHGDAESSQFFHHPFLLLIQNTLVSSPSLWWFSYSRRKWRRFHVSVGTHKQQMNQLTTKCSHPFLFVQIQGLRGGSKPLWSTVHSRTIIFTLSLGEPQVDSSHACVGELEWLGSFFWIFFFAISSIRFLWKASGVTLIGLLEIQSRASLNLVGTLLSFVALILFVFF